jgi:hypothetical protein
MTNDRCFFAKCCDGVVCSSKSTWTNLSELKNEEVKLKCFPAAETVLEVMLLRADLFFQHKFDTETAFVCDSHRNVLLQKVYCIKGKTKCDACLRVRGIISHAKADLRHISVYQAITLFEIFQLKNSYGRLICRNCRTEVSNKTELGKENLHNDAFECLFDPESICCVKDAQEGKDPDYGPLVDPVIGEEQLNEEIRVLNNFLSACGSKRNISVTKSYKDLSDRVKLRYIRLGEFLMRSMAFVIASDDGDIYTQDVFNNMSIVGSNVVLDGNFRQVMSGISEAYVNAESWQSRREILSVVAPKIPLKLIQLFIPGLTEYRFSVARLHAAKYGAGSVVESEPTVVQRFDDQQIAHFVDFIVSPHVCTDLPFGEKVLKLSSGIELFVPNTIRNMGATRIIDQYLVYCKEMCSDFEPLGKSSLFTILESCKASTRKSLQGIDYFAAEAGEAFDGIKKMIEEKGALCNDSNRLIENLKRARFYLKSDYKVHVTRSSNIADHCCIYALSDPKKQDFAQECDHEHDESCAECSNLTSTLNEIERLLNETEKNHELLDRTLKKFRSYRESIEAWKAHLLRSINQDLCREKLLNKLSHNEIYLNLDWAMKFLPTKSREPQSDFFGKRGISWHVTVVMKNEANIPSESHTFDTGSDVSDTGDQANGFEMTDLSEENENDDGIIDETETKAFKYKIFVHVFNQCSQDSETVIAILNDVLRRVKETDPQIEKAFIRSDNAGCYHSAITLVSC